MFPVRGDRVCVMRRSQSRHGEVGVVLGVEIGKLTGDLMCEVEFSDTGVGYFMAYELMVQGE